MRLALLIISLLSSSLASGHGGQPMAQAIVFQDSHPGVQWVLTDNQGVYANLKSGFRWLCEDAIAPSAGIRGLMLTGDEGRVWTVATTQGLFRSTDFGCGFERIHGPMEDRALAGLWRMGDRWLTGSAQVGDRNDLYLSEDEGQTWRALGLNIDGRILDLAISAHQRTVYAQTTQGLLKSTDGGLTFERLSVRGSGQEVPGNLMAELAISPQDEHVILLTVDAGTRTRLTRSTDGGATWMDVALWSHPQIKLLFAADGERVLAVSHLGLSWRSQDGGASWEEAAQIARGMDCLRRGPDSSRIWACGDIYDGAAWVTAYSDDFGLTFTPSLIRYEDTSERWDCEARDNAMSCCRGLCPGNLMSIDCGQPQPGDLPPQCDPEPPMDLPSEPEPDLGIAGHSDAGSKGDPSILVDANDLMEPRPGPSDDGCEHSGGGSDAPYDILVMLGLIVWWRARRVS